MKRLLTFFLVVACSLATLPTLACETEATAKPDSDCVVQARAQIRGVWFRLDKAEELRKAYDEIPELRLQINTYDQLIKIRDVQLAGYREASAARKSVSADLQAANTVLSRDAARARKERDEAIASRDAWYRSPFLWTGVGVVLTVATGATAVFLLK